MRSAFYFVEKGGAVDRRKVIMLIDDDPAVLELLRRKLIAYFDVVTTSDARNAVAMGRKQRPDLIVCDLDMPGMNGGQVAAALKQDSALGATPVLYLTSMLSPQEVKGLGGIVGGHRSISKRAPIPELVATINEALAAD